MMEPVTRDEKFMAAAAGEYSGELPTPISRSDHYWVKIIEQINAGSPVSPEDIDAAIETYLNSHDADIVTETELSTALNGYTRTGHSHQIADVTGLDSALAGKAPASHTHAQTDITDLDTTLAGKASVDHNHDNVYYHKDYLDAAINAAAAGASPADIQGAVNGYLNTAGVNNLFLNRMVERTATKSSDIFTLSTQKGRLSFTDGHISVDNPYNIYLFDVTEDTSITLTKNSGGILGAVVYSEHLDEISASSATASTYFVTGGRSDKTENPLPSAGNEWALTTGQMLAIYEQETANTDFTLTYTACEGKKLSNEVHLNTSQVAEVKAAAAPKRPSVRYGAVDTDIGSRGKEQISVFLPAASGYIKYAFVRCEYDPYNSNVWRIDRCYACDDGKNVLFPITNAGEWEAAVKINGASDFIGGNAHGDEVFTAFHILIDGVKVQDITAITETDFDWLSMVETSLMYDPRDGATLSTREQFTPIGTHEREYIISKDGIRLKQMIQFNAAVDLNASYMTMLPIIRGNDAVSQAQITDHYYSDGDYTEYDVSVGESGNGYGWRRNVTKATIWGNASGISATVEMLKQPDIQNGGARQFQVQSTVDAYNKLYWSICGVGNEIYSAGANERFVTDTFYRINRK